MEILQFYWFTFDIDILVYNPQERVTICVSVIHRRRRQLVCQSPTGAGDNLFVSHPPEQVTICLSVAHLSSLTYVFQTAILF